MHRLTEYQQLVFKYWLPPLLSGFVAWMIFITIGDTPMIRALGLGAVIIGIGLALRRMGAILCIAGSLTIAFCPAFWSQTGGGQGDPATIVLALAAASGAVLLAMISTKRPYVGLGIGIVVFAVLFYSQIGTPRSLRLTSFIVGWLLFLLVDMLLVTNPRPDSPAAPLLLRYQWRKDAIKETDAQPYHTLGMLLLFSVGVANDPLITLLAPCIILSLILSHTKQPIWYWSVLMLVVGIGLRGIVTDYLMAQSHLLALSEWRNASRWIDMIRFVISQFSIVGIVLSVLGLARLSRWYAPLGTVSLIGYAFYGLFGLVYNGPNRSVLILPLLIIQILWMTYAMFAISEWGAKVFQKRPQVGRLIVRVAYTLLPIVLLTQIVLSSG